ncbi:hypothetical protein [Microbacterium hydrocarbonoxydans]|uniref:hypothetical protein n=1 Tax=Microbacterium hydrocarbonoxydans TaxID=273678 RepID=UPI00203B30AD|nr:hypothetical protein [Microbacterium hydrocarbonoxydans]MCM3779867.1 hypothetical protein [Microbacterium hydrocarbonoxydans]
MTTQEAGLFSRVEDTRTVKGLLLPFGELSRPSLSKTEPVMFSASSVTIPRDPSAVTLNDEHDRFNPIGRATSLEVTDAGVVAEFSIFNTDEGDAYLANPAKRKLSAEMGSLVRKGVNAIRSRLTGAAVCTEGAFESAALFALAPGVTEEDASDESDTDNALTPDENGHLAVLSTTLPEDIAVSTPEGETATYTPDSAPVDEETPEKEETMTASAAGQTPAPLLTNPVTEPAKELDMHAVFSAMASVKAGVQVEDSETALFELADITTTGAGALPAEGVIQPAWVGKLWQGKEYVRKYLPLNNHTFGPIEIGGRAGFRLDGTENLVQKTNGEKIELPTGSATTSKRSSTRDRFGYAADVAAEWSYLSGGAEVLESFWKGVANSYAKVTDLEALATMYRVASRDEGAALSRLVAPGSLPAGTPANSQYYPGVVQLIQAIEAITDADDDPAWAVVNPVLWQQLIFTPKDLLPEFVSLAVGVGTGEANVDGKVTVRKAPQSAFIGTKATDPQVMAGSKNAIEFRELGTTPIQIDALNVAKFGVDRATVGFLETFVVRPEATVLIGTKAA